MQGHEAEILCISESDPQFMHVYVYASYGSSIYACCGSRILNLSMLRITNPQLKSVTDLESSIYKWSRILDPQFINVTDLGFRICKCHGYWIFNL